MEMCSSTYTIGGLRHACSKRGVHYLHGDREVAWTSSAADGQQRSPIIEIAGSLPRRKK
jgi:hypothetical protein